MSLPASSYDGDAAIWIGRLIAIGAIALLIGVPVLVIWNIRKTKREGGARFYEGIEGVRAGGEPGPGEVRLVYHTYSGFLIYVVQQTHDVVLPADRAMIVLERMLKHNLTRGLFAYGVLVIPILSYFEYRKQRRNIAAVAQRGFEVTKS
jgi:hypothetical protein